MLGRISMKNDEKLVKVMVKTRDGEGGWSRRWLLAMKS